MSAFTMLVQRDFERSLARTRYNSNILAANNRYYRMHYIIWAAKFSSQWLNGWIEVLFQMHTFYPIQWLDFPDLHAIEIHVMQPQRPKRCTVAQAEADASLQQMLTEPVNMLSNKRRVCPKPLGQQISDQLTQLQDRIGSAWSEAEKNNQEYWSQKSASTAQASAPQSAPPASTPKPSVAQVPGQSPSPPTPPPAQTVDAALQYQKKLASVANPFQDQVSIRCTCQVQHTDKIPQMRQKQETPPKYQTHPRVHP